MWLIMVCHATVSTSTSTSRQMLWLWYHNISSLSNWTHQSIPYVRRSEDESTAIDLSFWQNQIWRQADKDSKRMNESPKSLFWVRTHARDQRILEVSCTRTLLFAWRCWKFSHFLTVNEWIVGIQRRAFLEITTFRKYYIWDDKKRRWRHYYRYPKWSKN